MTVAVHPHGRCVALPPYSNNLKDLPEDLSGLQHVRTLRIKYNQLSRVPAAVMRLPQLTTLELSGNQITRLDGAVAKVGAGSDSSHPLVLACMQAAGGCC